MTPERFEDLAFAYGGDIGRWPQADREAARAFLRESPRAAAALAEADGLDAALDAWRTPTPDGHLMRRIAATARIARPAWRRAAVWWSGLAMAATAAAGAVTGAAFLAGPGPVEPAPVAAEMAYEPTAFGDLDGEGAAG